MRIDCDVGIIGAGVGGLAAAGALYRAGKTVCCLEATERIGGRILTVHDPLSPVAIELGAEFIHGRPPQTWDLIRRFGLTAFEQSAEGVSLARGRVARERPEAEAIPRKALRKDETFAGYIGRSGHSAVERDWATRYVEGFNAARADTISVQSLQKDARAADEIEGHRSFRIAAGYDRIPAALLPEIADTVHVNSIVERVTWRRGWVEVEYRSALTQEPARLRCKQLVVTVPLGVLQAGAIAFTPEPSRILDAARRLRFGQVYRITLRFDQAFWEENERLKGAGFLFSREKLFPTWWTTHPVISPVLTGWMAGTAAEAFHGADRAQVTAAALGSLETILGRKIPQPEGTYFHDWQADPFFRGAYSYVPVKGMGARAEMARPAEGTLFFAGEATETEGHGATVHGAIASGLRAAGQIVRGKP